MIETPFGVDSLAFNGLHSSVIVADAESYCMKMAGGAEVTEFFFYKGTITSWDHD